ncbi:MAG TPA: ATP-binding protein, partial [Thermoanaerobaculia bacterium]
MESSPTRPYKTAFIVVAAAFLFAVVAINGWISFREVVSVADKFEAVQRYSDTLDELNATLAALSDAQIAQRGYFLTGKSENLAPYVEGRAAVELHLRRLEKPMAGSPPLRLLRANLEEKLQELGNSLTIYRAGSPQAALAVVITARSTALMANIRRAAAELVGDLQKNRLRRRAQAAESSERAGVMIVFTSLIAALLLVMTFVQIGRATRAEHAARERAEASYAAEIKARMASEEANRVKDDFIATVSHELRTPLTAILGWSQVLIGSADPDLLKEGLDTIRGCALAQKRLIEDLLDVSRIMSGKMRLSMQTIDLAHVARAGVDTVRPAADAKGVHLTVEAEDPLRIAGDPDRLQQVIWNLVSNAVKFTRRGGSINVRVERKESQAVISVSDSGEGIEPDFLPHIFEPFRQADASKARVHKGLGLGLSIVKNLVEAHGGRVTVSSEGKGHGSTFRASLPITPFTPCQQCPDAPEAAFQIEDEDLQIELPSRDALSDVTVLVVDDHKPTLDLLTSVLRHSGATVHAASNAADGYASVRKFQPDVLVSDIGMPEEDGLTLIAKIRALPRNAGGKTPAIALT